jgi:hypothetical protein
MHGPKSECLSDHYPHGPPIRAGHAGMRGKLHTGTSYYDRASRE